MSERLSRVAAVVKADFLIRFRRLSTLVVFLLLSAFAYVWIPPLSTGRALLEVNGRRAIYNSAAIAMSTAVLGAVFIGLAGFYVVSNAIGRDVVSRCGFVIASTTMRGSEYLVGKTIGNVVFLTTFMSGFMLTSMAMVIVRGEGPLEPWVFLRHYALLVTPTIAFVSALAILFESIPWLSGKFGDVLYFFLWMAGFSVVVSLLDSSDVTWPRYFDFTGLGFLLDSLKRGLHMTDLSIGASKFDPKQAPFLFTGVPLYPEWIVPRIVSTLLPFSLLIAARLFFHRFDPARLRAAINREKRGWIARLIALFKPITRLLYTLGSGGGAARTDALLTLTAFPLSIVAILGIAIASLVAPIKPLSAGVLPIALAVVAIVIADVPCRERRAGTLALIYSAPTLRTRFVAWKLLSTLLTATAFLAFPAARLAVQSPAALPPFAVAALFVCTAATALGILSGNPKTFIVLFLSFWYLAVNDKGATPSLDFGGFFAPQPPAVTLLYLALSALLVAAAHLAHRHSLARN